MVDFNIFSFPQKVQETFDFQYHHNALYKDYIHRVFGEKPEITGLTDLPFLPIQFFKSHEVKTTVFDAEVIFESSGTTRAGNSRHHVKSVAVYRESFLAGFEQFYGSPENFCILALLPSYLERSNSSLILMADDLIKRSSHPKSGFYLDQLKNLSKTILELESSGQPTILLGVTFALMDFAAVFPMNLKHTIIMETGGMKGRREELTRNEVHAFLKNAWGLKEIHAEYGMTELLSQAYSKGDGIFYCPPWMKILLRAEDDPLSTTDRHGNPLKQGLINIIDLANRFSCSFIATDDLGILHEDGGFEVIGRMDNSDVRGCSLMVV
ncbi:acyl transferase [Pollutibacter soli]|uniref:LuxE/PaaK family acyltransferase n=1 Tax=Pollutibacter soli TaxID=3034157 RepID=UPI00301326FF